MSPQQLQTIFHVDTPDAVPHYEVVQLLHHDTLESLSQPNSHYRRRKRSIETQQNLNEKDADDAQQHVKKDLSKNPYFSEIKEKSAKSLTSNSIDDADKKLKNIKKFHKISFNAFGKDLNLTLQPSDSLFKNGQVHRLPMWYVDNEANATHGLNLQKIEDEVSFSFLFSFFISFNIVGFDFFCPLCCSF